MTIPTNLKKSYKPSYLSQILIDLEKNFSIGPQWSNRYEVTQTLTQPHLPQLVMTYHYHSHQTKRYTYESSYLSQILMCLQKMFSVGPQWEV